MIKYRVSLFFLISFSVGAAVDINSRKDFYLLTSKSSVNEVLNDFSINYNIPIIISNNIQGSYAGKINSTSAEDFLKKFTEKQQLTWFYDGDVIYFYNKNEMTGRLLTPNHIDVKKIMSVAREMKISNDYSCIIKSIKNHNAIDVLGVPKCIDDLNNLMLNLDKESQAKVNNKETIRIFKLKNASATDVTYSYRNKTVKVPGISSILKDMISNGPLSTESKGSSPLNGIFLNGGAQITSDPRQNAIIIKDTEMTMPLYENIIKTLDVKQQQIEVSVSIIDVNADNLEALGINWSGNVSFGKVGLSMNSSGYNSGVGNSIVANANAFMLKVNALENSSKAKILSQPSVITLDNMEAILDKSTTFYTKLIGEKNSALETITSGTLLKVTPRLLQHKHKKSEVKLSIEIQDGNQSDGMNQQNLPIVNNSVITTEAVLNSEQSLLLGGVIQEKESTDRTGISGLQDIPLIGSLFKSKATRKISVVRLFLINARPINDGRSI